jgi:hypothetical protein
MVDNPLLQLKAFDQSIWIDFIRRGMISSGQLECSLGCKSSDVLGFFPICRMAKSYSMQSDDAIL